jgi:hypothetical protein
MQNVARSCRRFGDRLAQPLARTPMARKLTSMACALPVAAPRRDFFCHAFLHPPPANFAAGCILPNLGCHFHCIARAVSPTSPRT